MSAPSLIVCPGWHPRLQGLPTTSVRGPNGEPPWSVPHSPGDQTYPPQPGPTPFCKSNQNLFYIKSTRMAVDVDICHTMRGSCDKPFYTYYSHCIDVLAASTTDPEPPGGTAGRPSPPAHTGTPPWNTSMGRSCPRSGPSADAPQSPRPRGPGARRSDTSGAERLPRAPLPGSARACAAPPSQG